MSDRELVVLGTASQAPTRSRNHNGYLLRWNGEGLLFDPGEGTQRQMLFAGVSATQITRICITHFHGDHCLGLPGVLARMSLDRVPHPVDALYPAQNREIFAGLRHPALSRDVVDLRERPVSASGTVLAGPGFRVETQPLSHSVPSIGYRLVEADGQRMLPDRLAALGITGPAIGRLQQDGRLATDGRLVTIDQVSEPRRGQRFAFIMDTRLCDGAFALADGADMLVCESTFADTEADLAREYGHLTAGQAAASPPNPERACLSSRTSRNATSTPATSSSPSRPPPRSAARSCSRTTWTALRCHPGMHQGPSPPRQKRTRGRRRARHRSAGQVAHGHHGAGSGVAVSAAQ